VKEFDCEVLIVGGGLVGSSLARALTSIPLSTVLVEARDPAALEQPSFDARVTALANGSRRILEGLGLWAGLAGQAQAIESIHISERGQFGRARILAADEGVAALGFTLENRVLGRQLWEQLGRSEHLVALAPARLAALAFYADHALAEVEREGETVRVRARLVAAADGMRSQLREMLGIAVHEDHYRQRAVIVNCATEAEHASRAFERFTPHGPLALLPMAGERMAVVWTLAEARASELKEASAETFRHALQQAFGYRLGRIERCGVRATHDLSRVVSARLCAERAVLIGNAALSLHPVAGQGFNLALRDIATLAEVLADEIHAGEGRDVGSTHLLARYQQWRARDQRDVAAFTHSLIRLFGIDFPGLGVARGLGLLAFDRAPGAKALLARQTMGLSGRLPRLARGLPL
jgi:2-octaprenyl-6-methoxyphenol hydroxylase